MSDFQAFLRCRKLFYFGNVLQRSANQTNQAVEDGAQFHEIMADVARGQMTAAQITAKYGVDDPMLQIAGAYLREHPLRGESVLVEEPIYTLVLSENDDRTLFNSEEGQGNSPAVYVRTTFDRVAREDDWIVGIDYKTFEKAPSFDDDRNFQFRTYTAVLHKHFNTDRVTFRVPYIRRALPGSPRGAWDIEVDGEFYSVTAAGKRTRKEKWLTSDCHLENEIVMSTMEVDVMWRELQDIARDLVRTLLVEHRWYRTPLNAGPHSCSSCFMREPCAAELRTGALSPDDLDFMTSPRDDATRMSATGMLADPRVEYQFGHVGAGDVQLEAVRSVYGDTGVAKLLETRKAVPA